MQAGSGPGLFAHFHARNQPDLLVAHFQSARFGMGGLDLGRGAEPPLELSPAWLLLWGRAEEAPAGMDSG